LVLGLGLAAIGVCTRFALLTATISFFIYAGTYYGTIRTPLSTYVWHTENIIFFVLLLLSITPDIHKLSLPRIRQWRSDMAATYRKWPEYLIIITLGVVYFGSAYCKLQDGGMLWMDGHTLRAYVFQKYLINGDPQS